MGSRPNLDTPILGQDFSYQTYPTYVRNTTANLKASYFFCVQKGPSVTHSTQHNGASWKHAAESQFLGLMLQLDLPVTNQDLNLVVWGDLRERPDAPALGHVS